MFYLAVVLKEENLTSHGSLSWRVLQFYDTEASMLVKLELKQKLYKGLAQNKKCTICQT